MSQKTHKRNWVAQSKRRCPLCSRECPAEIPSGRLKRHKDAIGNKCPGGRE